MDDNLFDEFGNYIGGDKASSNSSNSEDLSEIEQDPPDFIIDVKNI